MKHLFLWLGLAALTLFPACSQDDTSDPTPEKPEVPGPKVTIERIEFTDSEVELAKDNTAVATVRVTPAEAEVDPEQFRLVDAETGGALADLTFESAGETDTEAGTYEMRIEYTGGERKLRCSVRAEYGDEALQSDPIVVRAAPYTPVVRIITTAPVVDKETWIASTISIDGGNRFEDLAETDVSVRGRGNSTWAWEKKPYALKFPSKQKVLGMPKHKRWCLIANYMDRTHLRNRVAYYLGAHSKLDYTTRNEFAELYMNDEYMGCYLLTEQIKVDENRVNISETDGFLLEFDTYYDEDVKFKTASSNIPVNVKAPDPEDISDTQLATLQDYLNRTDAAVQALRNGTAGEDPCEYLDRESMIDFWIVFELMANHEMLHPKSVYFHKDSGGKLVAGPIWDFDYETLTDARRTGWINYQTSSTFVWAQQNWWNVLLSNDPAFRTAVKSRWQEWYPFLKEVPEFIGQERESIAEAVARDNERWPDIKTGDVNGDLSLTFGPAVDRLESVYRERLEWLNRQIAQW